jgi:hypothetical protein
MGVEIRMRNPVTSDQEVDGLLADLKKSPPAGLILTGHMLHTWGIAWSGQGWDPVRKILDGRGDIPTLVFFNLPKGPRKNNLNN